MGKQSVLKPEFRVKRRSVLERPVFEWGGVFESWSRGFVKRNFWRVRAIFLTEEDALHECAAVFLRCRNRYVGKLDEPQHMMALYQTALTRAWHSFAARDPHFRMISLDDDTKRVELPAPGNTEAVWDKQLASFASEVDSELRMVITTIINAPDEFLSIIFNGNDTKMITRRVSRMFGIKAGERDLIAELRDLVGGVNQNELMHEFALNALKVRNV